MSYIDTRELAEELEALESDEERSEEDTARMEALRALRDEVGDEWQYGATLIPEHMFTDYAQELAEDIGAVPSDLAWPMYCIDWERAASDLRMDYTSVTFDGDDYLVRL